MDKGYKKIENVFVDDYYTNISDIKAPSEKTGENKTVESKKIFSAFRELMCRQGKGKYIGNIDREILKHLVDDIEKIDDLKYQISIGAFTWEGLEAQYPNILRCLEYRKKFPPISPTMPLNLIFMSDYVSCEKIFKLLSTAKEDFLYELLGIEKVIIPKKTEKTLVCRNTAGSIAKRWERRWERINTMLDEKVAVSIMDREKVKTILEGLYWIRTQRNQINHAYGGVEVADNIQLEEKMIITMDLVEEVEKR